MAAAPQLHTQPWTLIGRPETAGCYCWITWLKGLHAAEAWAAKQKKAEGQAR